MSINFKFFFPVLFIFIFASTSINGQSKFEFGVGFLINHSNIDEKIFSQFGQGETTYKGIGLLALTTRLGYKFSDKFHLNSGVGYSRLGGLRKDLSGQVVASTLEVPLQLEWNPWKNIHFSSGLNYNYVYGIKAETEDTKTNLMSIIDTKHQFGLKHGVAVSYKMVELSLNYAHYFTDLFNLPLLDVNGDEVGTYSSKFRNFQVGLIFRR